MYAKLCLLLSVLYVAHSRQVRKTVSLSPSRWSTDTMRRLETISLRKNTRPKPLAFSKVQGLVSGTASTLAVHAGTEALRKGGNAMDACITTSMAEISLTAGAEASFAGVANILYYEHVTGRVHNLDAGWKIPRFRDWEQRPTLETLGDSVLVPGILEGMYEAAEFSKFPMTTLLEPALYFAENGFKMPHRLSKMVSKYYKRTLRTTKAGQKIFTNPKTKRLYTPTELFRQPQLAQFIRKLQRYGKNYVYRGNWTKSMVDVVSKHGGMMTLQDMAQYQAQWVEPASTNYNGYHVTTSGSHWGGVELVEMLKLLRLAGLSNTNDTYLTNATKLLALMSVSRYSKFISDYLHEKPRGTETIREYFHVDATPTGRISNRSAEIIWGDLNNREGVDMINKFTQELLSDLPDFDFHSKRKRGSAGIVAIDNDGNVCAMSHTANSKPWGTGLFVEGVALPHSGAVFQDLLVRLRPGSFVPSGLQPVIIFKNKRKKETPVQVTETPSQESTEPYWQPLILPRGEFIPPTRYDLENEINEIPVRVTENPLRRLNVKTLRPRTVPKEEFFPPSLFIRGMYGVRHKSNILPKLMKSKQQGNGIEKGNVRTRTKPKRGINLVRRALHKGLHLKPVTMSIRNVRRQHGRRQWQKSIERNQIKEEAHPREDDLEDITVEEPIEREVEEHVKEERVQELKPFEEEEPQTIGGLFTENDINSIFGKFSSRGYPRRFKTSRKKWFQNIVRQIFQQEKKKNKHRTWKMKFKRKTKKKRRRRLQPVAALAVIGQSAPEAALQYINNLLDNGLDAKQASDTPMFYSSIPGSSRQISRVERFTFSNDVINDVRSRGQEVAEVMHKFARVMAGAGAVLTVTEGKQAYGCSHPESEGFAESQ